LYYGQLFLKYCLNQLTKLFLPLLEAPHVIEYMELLPSLAEVDDSLALRKVVRVTNVHKRQVLQNQAAVQTKRQGKMMNEAQHSYYIHVVGFNYQSFYNTVRSFCL
jgi:hypothetical protein